MQELTKEVISTILQIIAFSLIPFIFFLFRKDKSVSFFRYIGLYRPTNISIIYALATALLFVAAGVGLAFLNDSVRAAMLDPNSVTGRLRAMGFTLPTVLTLLVMALFKTALSEEIFFRGFLGKQLVNKLGFTTGNITQAVIFGLVHLLLLWKLTDAPMFAVIFIFIFSTLAGWTIGYIKAKYANGSIVPGWIAHGIGNTISYSIIAFVL